MATEQNFNNQDDDSQQQQNGISTGGGGLPASTSGSNTPAVAAGQQPQQRGSGRYTNLQKYLNANQGAGDRLYQGIGSQLQRDYNADEQKATTEASKVREGIESSRENLNRGQNYYNQIQDQNFNAQNFAQDQNQVQDFVNFRQGQVVDPNALSQQNAAFQNVNAQALQNLQQRQNQIGTEEGRYGLLQQVFGGRQLTKPQYTTGQQRLDQLFLQGSPGNNINNLQNQIVGNIGNVQNFQNQAGQFGQNINQIGQDQSQLAQNLTNRSKALEENYINALSAQIPQFNQARDTQRQQYQNFFNTLIGQGTPESVLDSNLMNQFQLRQNEQTFNVLNDPNLTLRQIADISDRNAESYRDVANQQNVDYYDALAKLAFGNMNNNQFNLDPAQKRLTQASTLEAAAQAKRGEGSLRNRLDSSMRNFIQDALNTNLTAVGSDSYQRGWDGTQTNTYTAGQNVGAFLGGGDANSLVQRYSGGLTGGDVATGFTPEMIATKGFNLPGSDVLNSLGDQINNISDTWFDDNSSDSMRIARDKAMTDLQNQITGYLQNQGFFNYLSNTGNRAGESKDSVDYGYGKKVPKGFAPKLGVQIDPNLTREQGYYYDPNQYNAGGSSNFDENSGTFINEDGNMDTVFFDPYAFVKGK